jgi:hypothetical protein
VNDNDGVDVTAIDATAKKVTVGSAADYVALGCAADKEVIIMTKCAHGSECKRGYANQCKAAGKYTIKACVAGTKSFTFKEPLVNSKFAVAFCQVSTQAHLRFQGHPGTTVHSRIGREWRVCGGWMWLAACPGSVGCV